MIHPEIYGLVALAILNDVRRKYKAVRPKQSKSRRG
jgi:hypothetical protein